MNNENKKNILLVEDEAVIAMTEKMHLEKYGYIVHEVTTGEKAVQSILEKTYPVDIILMDINLGSGMDGTQAAELILNHKEIPVLFLSSHTEPEIVAKTEKITSYGYVVKGSSITVLDASIKMALKLFDAKANEKINKEALQISEERYINLFENMKNAVAVYKPVDHGSDFEFLHVNKACEFIDKISREKIIGKKVTQVFPGVIDFGLLDVFKKVYTTGEPAHHPIAMYTDERLQGWRENYVYKLSSGEIIAIYEDITERKQLEINLKAEKDNLQITLNSIGDAVISTDHHGKIVRMNPVAEKLCGRAIADAYGKNLEEVFHIINAGTRKRVNNPAALVLKTGTVVGLANHTVLISKDGREYQIADSAAPIKAADGTIAGVVLVFRDVTEEYEKERKYKESMRSIEWMLLAKNKKEINFTPEYGDLTALNKNGIILSSLGKEQLTQISSEYLDLLGTSSAIYEKNGDYALGIFSSGWCQELDGASRKLCGTTDNKDALSCGKWLCHESCWREASLKSIESGEPSDVACAGGLRLYAVPIRAHGSIIGAINFGYGNPPTDDITLQKLSDLCQIPFEILKKKCREYQARPQFIIDYAKKRLESSAVLIGNLVERKQVEESLQKSEQEYRTLFDEMLDGFALHEIICDTEGQPVDYRFLAINPAFERIVGPKAADIVGKTVLEVMPDTEKYWIETYGKVALSGEHISFENYSAVLGKYFEVTAFCPAAGQFVCIFKDITERKTAQEKIQKQLAEKEILLREVHHRVKNNITNIESYLYLQAGSSTNDEVTAALQETISRVQSIRVLYDKLLLSKDLHEISIKVYIEELIVSLRALFAEKENITIEENISDFTIPTKQAETTGIIINELLTNVFKYAFKERNKGKVSVSIHKNENKVTVTIQDNGIGIDERIHQNTSPGFGLTIVKMLTEQLKGTYKTVSDNGTKSTIQFTL